MVFSILVFSSSNFVLSLVPNFCADFQTLSLSIAISRHNDSSPLLYRKNDWNDQLKSFLASKYSKNGESKNNGFKLKVTIFFLFKLKASISYYARKLSVRKNTSVRAFLHIKTWIKLKVLYRGADWVRQVLEFYSG